MQHSDPLRAVPVVRDDYGYWTHPDYFVPAGDREYGAPGEYEQWLEQNRLEYAISWMENEALPEAMARYRNHTPDCRLWEPVQPAGDGWFVGSIHETEDDGPVCIWLRHREEQCTDV